MTSLTLSETDIATVEKDFERVLTELMKDKSLDKFRIEYEKLHNALKKSHGNEKKLMQKCKEISSELISNASKVGEVMKLSTEDENNMALLKNEIDKAWKMVDISTEKEKKSKSVIQQLRAEIANLTKTIEEGTGLNTNTEITLNDLLRKKHELSKENMELNKKIDDYEIDFKELNNEVNDLTQLLKEKENQILIIKIELNKREKTKETYNKKIEKFEKIIFELKKDNIEYSNKVMKFKDELKNKENTLNKNKRLIKEKDLELNRINSSFEQIKNESQQLIEQLELMKEEENVMIKETKELKLIIKQKDNENINLLQIISKKDKLNERIVKDKENLQRQYKNLIQKELKLQSEIKNLKKDAELNEKDFNEKNKKIKNLEMDIKKVKQTLQTSKDQQQKLLLEIKSLKNNKKELLNDNNGLHETINDLNRKLVESKKQNDKILSNVTNLTNKNKKLKKSIETLNLSKEDFNTLYIEERNKLKKSQALYENIRGERNIFCQNLNESQDEISELKRKFKIMSHQISQYKEEVSIKDKGLIKQHFEMKELKEQLKSLDKQRLKKDEIIMQCNKLLNQQNNEIKLLRRQLIEAHNKSLFEKKIFNDIISERDILGSQLIRRNDELALIYDKLRIMTNRIEKGEKSYNDLLDNIKNLTIKNKNMKRQLDIKKNEVAQIFSLKSEIHYLQRELLSEKTKVKGLSEELENPINVHRWRKLMGSDPESYELINKINKLQKRLINKTEIIVEKNLVIKEKERTYNELKNILARQPGPEIIEQLTKYQKLLNEKTKLLKMNKAEFNMININYNKLQYDYKILHKNYLNIKKKYFQQKKKEQLWTEEQRQRQKITKNKTHSNSNDVVENRPPSDEKQRDV